MRASPFFLAVALSAAVAELEDSCLACMCYVSSDGCVMPDEVCRTTSWSEVCGPWAVTKPYWEDAHKPGGEFYTCMGDWDCNEQTVRAYLDRYVSNPYASCETYARTHYGGPWGMNEDYATDYWLQVKDCLDYGLFTPPPSVE
ncbi:lysozyme [Penaeus vannamei]|uniref:lysozyme n=1 Tax=Penaeus vannamei TaxID=6689 RepID=Q20AT0_PENVA|nr:lysozyme-like [Penaeus vannamei]ABD65298.1 destabilase I [Penaeus vannamei]AET36867.1 invertebrate-type lysozyme [Penaeus vannamei]ROT76238.1 destabilase I [Penaeus vannamei]